MENSDFTTTLQKYSLSMVSFWQVRAGWHSRESTLYCARYGCENTEQVAPLSIWYAKFSAQYLSWRRSKRNGHLGNSAQWISSKSNFIQASHHRLASRLLAPKNIPALRKIGFKLQHITFKRHECNEINTNCWKQKSCTFAACSALQNMPILCLSNILSRR